MNIHELPVGTVIILDDELVKIVDRNGVKGVLRNPPPSVNIYAPDFNLMDYITPFENMDCFREYEIVSYPET